MRFQKHVNEMNNRLESMSDRFVNVTLKDIRERCSDYLKLRDVALYRGTRKTFKGEAHYFAGRVDRKPKDMPPAVHRELDDEFKKKFGWKARSEGIFVTPSEIQARDYGQAYMFFPINGYKYVWSDEVEDLFSAYNSTSDDFYLDGVHFGTDAIVGTYTNKNIERNGSSEMMFYCPKGYYLMDVPTWYYLEANGLI